MGRKINDNEKVYLKKVGKILKNCRKDRTQNQVSKEIGISTNDISKYERGEKDISVLTLKKFCNYYKIDISSLLYKVDHQTKTSITSELDLLQTKMNTFLNESNKIIRKIRNSN